MRARAGFSLVEVVVALGLLGAVLVSVSGMFTVAGRQIRSGRNHSAGLAVARDLLEELASRPYRRLYGGFGLSGSAASCTIDSRFNPYASSWQQALDAELHRAHARIEIAPADGAASVEAAAALRITVTVSWHERTRVRSLRLATLRT